MLSKIQKLGDLRFAPHGEIEHVSHDERLDGLRGFAAVSVMLVHRTWLNGVPLANAHGGPNEYLDNLHMARIAVLLFFITSGYVIGLTNRESFSWGRAKEYLRRRCLRIVPIYIVAVFAGWLAQRNVSAWTVLGNLFFLQNPAWGINPLPGNIPLWSLHNEVVYYLGFLLLWAYQPRIFPLVLVLLTFAVGDWFHGGTLSFLGGWSVGGFFWLAGLLLSWNRSEGSNPLSISVLSLVLLAFATNQLWPGVILLKGFGFPYAGESTVWLADLLLLPIAVTLFCAVTGLRFPGQKLVGWVSIGIPVGTCAILQLMGRLWVSAPWIMACIATISALPLIAFDDGVFGRALFKPFVPLGKISYGLYLFHVPCVALVNRYYHWDGGRLNYLGGAFVWLGLSVLSAWICEAMLQPKLRAVYRRHMAGHTAR